MLTKTVTIAELRSKILCESKGSSFFINNIVKNFSDMFYIYKSTNKINSKFYIGRCKGPVKNREYKHWWYARLYKTSFYWIDKLKPYYNATLGGDGGSFFRELCPLSK
jgi:hypothetical protein